jgi:NAD(P)H-hydrate epimerase
MPVTQKSKRTKQTSANHLPNRESTSEAVIGQAARILGPLDGQKILVCVGRGKTGSLGLAAAVKLKAHGARPSILLAYPPDDLLEESRLRLTRAEALHIPITVWSPQLPYSTFRQDLLVDALLGAKTKGDPKYPLDQIIVAINDSRTPVLALDLPSGLNPLTGEPGRPTVVAMVTLPIVVPRTKLLNKKGALFIGKLVSVT